MVAGVHYPSITPTLVLCLGDFGERVAQALVPEIKAAGPAVQAAVHWLRLTWPESSGVRLANNGGQVLLETGGDDSELLAAVRARVEESLRNIGLHATRERLLRAGHGLPDDSPAGRQLRCYLVAALGEAPVVAILTPLLTHLNALLTFRHGPRSVTAFLNVATHSLDPDAPRRTTVTTALQILPDLLATQPSPRLWPCVLFDWVKTGGVYAEGEDELSAALVALLRVLLLADEPAALLQEAFPKTLPVDGASSVFCSLGVAVIQCPPREAVLDWLAARLMAEFLSRRCLEPLEGPLGTTLGNGQQEANCLQLENLLQALAEGLGAGMTADLELRVSLSPETFGQPSCVTEKMAQASQSLMDQIGRQQSALKERLLSKVNSTGQLVRALAKEIDRGPHGLGGAEALLKAVAGHIQNGLAVLSPKLARWPLRHERLTERVRQTRATLDALRQALPDTTALLFRSGVAAVLWGGLFGTWAGHLCGGGEIAGALLTAVLVVVTMGLWYVCFKQWQLRRARRDYVTAVAALQSAPVERAWLEAAQAVLTAAETWRKRQAQRLQAARKLLHGLQRLLDTRPLQLSPNPIIIETLPYLDGYANWLQTVLQNDPLMQEVQTALEREQMLAGWSDLKEKALLKTFIEAGRRALPDVPELSVEDILASQDVETLRFHLGRLHQLATPLIDLNRPAMTSQSGGLSTIDIACWEQGPATRLRGWPENQWSGSISVAATGDPQRVTYIRLVSGFDLGNLCG